MMKWASKSTQEQEKKSNFTAAEKKELFVFARTNIFSEILKRVTFLSIQNFVALSFIKFEGFSEVLFLV
jgi:hypothetical protein